MDLAVKDKLPEPISAPGAASDDASLQPKTVSLTPDLKESLGLVDCEPGDTYTIKLQAGEPGDEGAQDFDVISSEPDEAPAGPGDEDDVAEEKALGYKRPKSKSEKESPSTAAESLMD